MRVVNYTKLPEDTLKGLLRFAAKGTKDSNVEVHVKNEPHHPHGYCYTSVPHIANVAKGVKSLITLHLPSTPESSIWPKKWWNGHGLKRLALMFPNIPFDDWKDCVVYLAAHEFRHVWQKHRRQRHGWKLRSGEIGKRTKLRLSGKCEHDASKHGIMMVSKYRVATGRTAIEKVKQANPFVKKAVTA